MALLPGTNLGPYKIIAPLGSGGMGEVYRARDTRLLREVAVKILPHSLATDPGALERFRREAQAASALNHPNIVTVYDVGAEGATHYIVMELVVGRSLRTILREAALDFEAKLALITQIADALASVHAKGLVHRDLKPENILVTDENVVKLLDFGLAKITAPPVLSGETTATHALNLTGEAAILGTVGYMSPEQAAGETADFRADQFAFGAICYELATGRQPFDRRTGVETLAAIIREQPQPIGEIEPDLPWPFRWAVERCLAKRPEDRYPSTRDLARDLAALRDRRAELPAEPPAAAPRSLPVQRTPFVGRDAEIARVKPLLLDPSLRLVTLTGPGGTGKTRLALQVAAEVAAHFSGGICFVNLAPIRDPKLVPSTIAQALGVRETRGRPLADAVHDYLRSLGPFLLLLDNLEQIVESAPLLLDLLTACPAAKLLVTSRVVLHVYGEQEFFVPPLPLPDTASVSAIDHLAGYASIALFVQRASAVRPDFKLTPENAAAVVEICRRLDGLPLAIELAAARVKILPPAGLLARIQSRLELLTGGARDLPERQQALRRTIDWSYELLTPAEQKLFRRLSVFVAGSTLDAAEAVANTRLDLEIDVLDGVTSLVDKSLLRQSDPEAVEPRFTMLETIREYGRERLAESGEAAATERAHAAYFLVLAEEGATELRTPERSAWVSRCDDEHDNFRAAVRHLIATGQGEWGLRLGTALLGFWEQRERFTEGRETLAALLAMPDAAAPTAARAKALFAAVVMSSSQGDFDQARKAAEEGLEIYRGLGDKRGMVTMMNTLAVQLQRMGRLVEARSLFEDTIGVLRELGEEQVLDQALTNLANLAKAQGDYAIARTIYEQTLRTFRARGDTRGVASALSGLGDLAVAERDYQGARQHYLESLTKFRESKDRWGIARALTDLGNLMRDDADYLAACTYYREALLMSHELGHQRGIARILESLAWCAGRHAYAELALRLTAAAAAIREKVGLPPSGEEQERLELVVKTARQELSPAQATKVWSEGWAMSADQAIEHALSIKAASPQ